MAGRREPGRKLSAYREKRDFERTGEPRGAAPASASGRLYCVQKHAARQLHYDLRLELDGVLLSWAVPRGPCLDPKQKILAVQVEDHPIEYGDFEGAIPEGEYGAGTVMLWDRGAWEPIGDPSAALEKGDLKFRLVGEKLRGEWVLARMKGDGGEGGRNWLLIKKRDDAARPVESYNVLAELPFSVASGRSMEAIAKDPEAVWKDGRSQPLGQPRGRVSFPPNASAATKPLDGNETRPHFDFASLPGAKHVETLPAKLAPQLATAQRRPPSGAGWLHEPKLDGYRLLCRIGADSSSGGGGVRLFTRNGHDWTARLETVARAAGRLPLHDAFLDGELVVLGRDGLADFGLLQNAFQRGGAAPFTYFVFDMPYAESFDLRAVPLIERKRCLAAVLERAAMSSPTFRYGEHFEGEGAAIFEKARALGLEGIVSKRAESRYESRRAETWIKVKATRRQVFIVGGFTSEGAGRSGFGALLVGFRDESGRLVYCGRVGGGFDERTLRALAERLERLRTGAAPFVNPEDDPDAKGANWVEPRLAVEVEFSTWTAGGLLRHPVYVGTSTIDAAGAVRAPASAASVAPTRAAPTVVAPHAPEDAFVAGVRITHPARTVYPEERLTKFDLAEYYAQIAEWILPHVASRPLSIVRCPLGLAGESFYQRHVGEGFPQSIRGIRSDEANDGEPYLLIDGVEGLIALAQMGVLEIHVWGCRADQLERPDRLVFDLDPGEGIVWGDVCAGAVFVRDRLSEIGLDSFVKTTGGKGAHVVVPIVRRTPWDEAKAFAHAFARHVVKVAPRNFVSTLTKRERERRIYVDWLRNTRGATAVAAYSTRARPGACVSAPLAWDELSADRPPEHYTVRTIPDRLARLESDPWEGLERAAKQSITASVRRAVGL